MSDIEKVWVPGQEGRTLAVSIVLWDQLVADLARKDAALKAIAEGLPSMSEADCGCWVFKEVAASALAALEEEKKT